MLRLSNFTVSYKNLVIVQKAHITVDRGELVVLMGPNGSGKSTLASAVMGHPFYTVHAGSLLEVDGENITDEEPNVRAQKGIFLAFQNPVSIPGVSVTKLLREAGALKDDKVKSQLARLRTFSKDLHFDESLLSRGLNDGFSGGEKKKIEMIQASVLATKYALFDEIDTGLDIDALKKIAYMINELKKRKVGCVVITHYQRLVEFLDVDRVLIMAKGHIVKEGDKDLVHDIEKFGYIHFSPKKP